jgi:L-histidine N-alpha-methyltransferase
VSANEATQSFFNDVVAGLSATPRNLPCKYLYDARGSELFEAICQTEDYYVTRADLAVHEAHIGEISTLAGPGVHVVEMGSGAGVKTRKLLAGLDQPRAYTPIEISAAALAASARELRSAFPDIEIRPLRADYTQPISAELLTLDPPAQRRLVYFPGSTISNFEHAEAAVFLQRMANIAGDTGAILIGVDLFKSEQRLLAAYDDRDGITAAFNLNLLHRINRELDATVDVDAFSHEARFNPDQKRIEMYLVARRYTQFRIGSHTFAFEAGDSIHTENSHKYSVADFRRLAERAGLHSVKVWKDPDKLFSMHLLEKPSQR